MIGDVIGNYRVTGEIGAGGMGAVYLAEHQLIGRQAAIKVLLSEFSSNESVVNRFFNEARAATSVKHPGIVEIYDFGYHEGRSAYIVMEHLEGESLDARIKRCGRMPAAEVLRLARHMVGALAAAHEKGIVHRDLKPDNVFVVPDPGVPGGERTKLLDFGIAKLADQGAPGSFKTRTGSVMGTPGYMAPEQCKGAGQVDHRADLYAMGCLLFEMLCGRCPFVAEGGGEVMAQHIYAQPPAPRALDPSISPELEALVLRLLAKQPADRLSSAVALRDAIDQLLGAPHVTGATPTVRAPSGAESANASNASPAPVQTTLSSAAGAAGTAPPTQSGGSSRRWVLPVAAGTTLAVVGLAVALVVGSGGGAQDDETEVAAAAADVTDETGETQAADSEPELLEEPDPVEMPEKVAVSIDSVPSGAEIRRSGSGLLIGKTPWSSQFDPRDDEHRFTLELDGYEDVDVAIDGSTGGSETIELERVEIDTRSERRARKKADSDRRKRAERRKRKKRKKQQEPESSGEAEKLEEGGSINPF